MKPGSLDIPLHDIKPLVEIQEHSLLMLSALLVFALLASVALMYLLWRFIKGRKKANLRQNCFKALENIDLSKSKEAAYLITKYGRCFADDSPRLEEAYSNLVSKLAPYKYKKEVEKIDKETISFYQIYVGMIDV